MTPRLASIFACLALLLAACSDGDAPSASPPAAADLLTQSAQAVKAVRSFHFELSHENGSTPMPLNLQLVSASGDVVVPDRLQADVKAKAASVAVSLSVVGIGDQTWVTNPFTRRWQTLPGVSVNQIADPTGLVEALLANLRDAQVVGEADIAKQQTYKLSGSVDSSALSDVFSTSAGLPVAVELWIGIDDSLPRRARLSGPVSKSEPSNIVRQVDLSRFNATVEIKPPQ